jgi:NADH-quinone oxidoreductase subunit M
VIYERAHTRDIKAFGGMATRMPMWAAYFALFMYASIGLPGLSGFVGEVLVALGTWEYNKLAAAITFSVVIFAAWYMLWLFQRVVFGRAWGEAPDPGDTQLTAEEEAELTSHKDSFGVEHGGLQAHPVSGGDHDAEAHDHEEIQTGSYPTHEGQRDSLGWRDVTFGEHLALAPLAILTIVFGVYPKPLLDIVEPSFQAILEGAARVIGN